ncbi:hypothetical protein TNIN_340631 [Trichonephila inaurata madagascariensis]|uniref:Uncharacterized protein n=1 Tax=Trichonephila inaurata madagascariensis TaxID=2747483 RepID=A0A8X6Y6H6_9ARAC|nr:hypothetical protein TNIN_340631 [Trichonephila inaurata madagascariensis]
MHYGGEKQRYTGCHSLLLMDFQQCGRNPLAQPVRLTQVKSKHFTGNVELSGKFTTRLTTVLLNGRLQGFVIQGLWSSCSSFIEEGQISRPEFLKPMLCRAFIDPTVPKRLTYSAT